MIFEKIRTILIHSFTMNVDLGFKRKKIRGGVQGFMIECKDFYSNINFE